jgi:hypothetical protein
LGGTFQAQTITYSTDKEKMISFLMFEFISIELLQVNNTNTPQNKYANITQII